MADRPLEELTLSELELRCRQETRRFEKTGQSDSRYCFEIVRQALRLHSRAEELDQGARYADEPAQTRLIEIYTPRIKSWINRNAASNVSDVEDIVQIVWLKLWAQVNQGLDFDALPLFLGYLKRITITVVIEFQRRRSSDEISLEEIVEDAGDAMLGDRSDDPSSGLIIRDLLRTLTPDPVERAVLWYYSQGDPPRHIAVRLQIRGMLINGEVPTAEGVSTILERVKKRLKNDPSIRKLLSND